MHQKVAQGEAGVGGRGWFEVSRYRACIPSDDTVATARPDRSSKPRAARSALGLQTLRRQSHGAPEPAGRFLAALDGLNRLFGLQKKVTELGTPQRTGRARGSDCADH